MDRLCCNATNKGTQGAFAPSSLNHQHSNVSHSHQPFSERVSKGHNHSSASAKANTSISAVAIDHIDLLQENCYLAVLAKGQTNCSTRTSRSPINQGTIKPKDRSKSKSQSHQVQSRCNKETDAQSTPLFSILALSSDLLPSSPFRSLTSTSPLSQ
ncbi:hypothetical protein PCASD_16365 [Puccinia coronata f. sp. avenae]|uniref:Uncharacterized protein n=1 Tax=Puccinia coronata f. sp. avenae TaxID=200324 RepID=A0A2N5SW27_9BASI|nr:hypothetical protein PCASD_16365 [Puccinia coronata f. sp. avenae]